MWADGFGLTPKQREALVTALNPGLYDVSPKVTLEEVAKMLDISQQAVSKRLQRARGNPIRNGRELP